MSNILTLAHKRPARMSQKLRDAIRLHETEGLPVTDACGKAGLSGAAWSKAIKRSETQNLIPQVRQDLIASAETKRAFLKVKALEVALDLMLNSKSEAIRARMVEFLASDAKVSPVAVHIDARQVEQPSGYRYRRPEGLGGPDNGDPQATTSAGA